MTTQYFSDMNYSMANEDTGLEFQMVKQLRPRKIISVCGSGGRALPLICGGAEELVCVDLAKQQLLLLELRKEGIRRFSHKEYLIFWGYAPYYQKRYTEKRQELFESLELSEDCYKYFKTLFMREKFSGILYLGNWESTFVKFSKISKVILGAHAKKACSFDDLDNQREYFKNEFPWKRWNLILHIIGNRSVFNALLYKGHFVKKNVSESFFKYYDQAFKNLFFNDLLKKSFFGQLCFMGEIVYEEGNTVEALPECFELMKKSLKDSCKVSSVKGDLIETIKDYSDVDFISMSDVPSYFEGKVERNFLQQVRPHLSPKGIVVIRSYLRVPNVDRSGFIDITEKYSELISQEKVQMYKIEVLQNG